jgi:DNA polymerase-3 subunit epsilon
MQNLPLDRPLVCFDLETTGTDVAKDRIVQIAMIRVEPGGERRTLSTLVNPQRPIPPEASAVHGIRDEHVRNAPSFSQLRAEVEEFLDGADLAGFNMVNFDLPLLEAEIRREGGRFVARGRRLLDAMRIFHLKEPRNLEAAVRFYCGRELEGAHSAEVDALASLEVLDAQLARYPDLPRDPDALHAFCNPDAGRWVDRTRKFRWNDQGEAVFAFGKHEGRSLREMMTNPQDRGYLEWMLGKDFTEEVKGILKDALGGVFPVREGR